MRDRTMQGRGRAETLKWFETGSRTVAHFDPSVGGERVTVRALQAAEDSWVLVTGVRGVARLRDEEKVEIKAGEKESLFRDTRAARRARTLNVDIFSFIDHNYCQ